MRGGDGVYFKQGYDRRFDSTPVSRELLAKMAARLLHRGPDDTGIWTQGDVGFAHTRLSIRHSPTSAAHSYQRISPVVNTVSERQAVSTPYGSGSAFVSQDSDVAIWNATLKAVLAHARNHVTIGANTKMVMEYDVAEKSR
jgi:hypothetical protein